MAKRGISLLLILVLILAAVPPAFGAEAEPTKTINDHFQDYRRWAYPQHSYLHAVGDNLERLEYYSTDSSPILFTEMYTQGGRILSKKSLTLELPLFGGCYFGSDYNYLIFGKANYAESSSAEVIRVVRYTPQWKRVDSVSLKGENTQIPFYCGSLSMTEQNGILYVLTSHNMFASQDGLNHQANLLFAVRERDMKVLTTHSKVSSVPTGYVSHSLNQFTEMDGNRLVTLEQGDMYPRSVTLYKYPAISSTGTLGSGQRVDLLSFRNVEDSYYTGASLGGFAVTSSHYLAAGTTIDQSNASVSLSTGVQNLFIATVPRSSLSASQVKVRMLTSFGAASGTHVSTPQLLKLPDGRVLVLWTTNQTTLQYVFLKPDGSNDSQIYTVQGRLSDCVPTIIGNKIFWYVTSQSVPTFYSIDLRSPGTVREFTAGKASVFTDVPSSQYYYEPVYWALDQGITTGMTATTFVPGGECTRAQVVTFLWRANGSPKPKSSTSPFKDVKKGAWYYDAVLWAVENGITNGMSATTFAPGQVCTRAQVVTFLWRNQKGGKATASNPFKDVKKGAWYYDAVLWAVGKKITNGMSATTFGPDQNCTRGQIVTFLWRALD